ncbi:hypothetical protein TNCV_492221 [Trichonephila clavipes]|nr:hypothetical protein TNCV_492221 [Trichonephila clavipes]
MELRQVISGNKIETHDTTATGGIRTHDSWTRSPTRYPLLYSSNPQPPVNEQVPVRGSNGASSPKEH